jgi:hypothetical protein
MESRDENLSSNEESNPIQIVGVYAQEDEAFYLHLKKSLHLWERQGHLSWLEPVRDSISNPGQGVFYGDIAHKTELGRCKQDRVSLHSMNGLQ